MTCGFRPSVGFAYSDDNGKLSGFLVDFCHALAAAVLGDADAIRAERLPDKPGEFVAVENHAVDIAFHNTTWTLSRDVSYAIQFTVPIFYDGRGLLSGPTIPRPLCAIWSSKGCALNPRRPPSTIWKTSSPKPSAIGP